MASPQWKNFQPSAQDSAMSNCEHSLSYGETQDDDSHRDSNSSSPACVTRETGIVEKLLHSYGFIQCCERQARLFFHYSQFSGTIEHLKLGDAVEFEMTYDRRTGKPIASNVCKITSDVDDEERVSGFVTTECKENTEGRVAYENRGECFFLPYGPSDVDEVTELHPHDKVTFRISTDETTGNLRASTVRLDKGVPPRHQGVICALKETFGFIERADVVQEIFFHTSECKAFRNLSLGEDVEFGIQIRNNKEVAVNVVCLPSGTVVFEDISPDLQVGQIVEIPDKATRNRSNDPIPGKIVAQIDNEEKDFAFGERDPKYEYTLQVGDWVQFNISTDRRDNLKRATNIELLEDGYNFNKEKREQGFVTALKETFGFITYAQQDTRLYFRLTEVLNAKEDLKVRDEVEFTAVQDPSSPGRSLAIRIKVLPLGTLEHHPGTTNGSSRSHHHDNTFVGIVEKEARWESPPKDTEDNVPEKCHEGVIVVSSRNSKKEKFYFTLHDYEHRTFPKTGDKVEFSVSSKGDKQLASHVKVLSKVRNGYRYSHRGFVAALKETFGFIETEDHDKEVFFHYSVFEGNAASLEVGQEVEYGVTHKGNKLSAECVKKLTPGTIPKDEIQPEVLNGTVVRPLRCFNPDQELYSGKIRIASHAENMEENLAEYEFGITSLEDKHEFLQKGDVVQFQIGVSEKGKERATNIKAIRTRIQATVDTIKGNFGFLCYEAEEGKKLFFHMSELKGDDCLSAGDKVEFIVVHHQRTGKYSACSVVKIGEGPPMQRPERLNRLRTISTNGEGPRIILIRQPKGPDGTSGFKTARPAKTERISRRSAHESCSLNNENHVNDLELNNPIVCS